jgi:hypothetical protein
VKTALLAAQSAGNLRDAESAHRPALDVLDMFQSC